MAHRDAGARIDNLPLRDETWDGIASLARELLDPLRETFGSVEITYGFAAPPLTRHIRARISPPHDQHAGSELNRLGARICSRGGQACDLRVPGVSSVDVARWAHGKLPIDRMYLYGSDRPLHLSYGPEAARYVCAMVRGQRGLIPREVSRSPWEAVETMLAKR